MENNEEKDHQELKAIIKLLELYMSPSTKEKSGQEIIDFVRELEKKISTPTPSLLPPPPPLPLPHEYNDKIHVGIRIENEQYHFLYDDKRHSQQDKKLLDFYLNEFLIGSSNKDKIDCVMRLSDIIAIPIYKSLLLKSLVKPYGLDKIQYNEIAKKVWFIRVVHPNDNNKANILRFVFENDEGKIEILHKNKFMNYWGEKKEDRNVKKRVRTDS